MNIDKYLMVDEHKLKKYSMGIIGRHFAINVVENGP
jgi:hypothetical protein